MHMASIQSATRLSVLKLRRIVWQFSVTRRSLFGAKLDRKQRDLLRKVESFDTFWRIFVLKGLVIATIASDTLVDIRPWLRPAFPQPPRSTVLLQPGRIGDRDRRSATHSGPQLGRGKSSRNAKLKCSPSIHLQVTPPTRRPILAGHGMSFAVELPSLGVKSSTIDTNLSLS
jgi:hypothetical protein